MNTLIPDDECIICKKPMSRYSRHVSMRDGFSATICSICRSGVKNSPVIDFFLKSGGLLDIIKKIEKVDMQEEEIYAEIQKVLDKFKLDGEDLSEDAIDVISNILET